MNPTFDPIVAEPIHLSHLVAHASSPPPEPLLGSIVLPNTYWSSVEKASFFASVARHSRWRPDMIAEDMGDGKTVADVCSYIELLEQYSSSDPQQELRRETVPSARQVSEVWMEAEEAMAVGLQDSDWLDLSRKRKRKVELKEAKELMCAESEALAAQEDNAEDGGDPFSGPPRKCQRLGGEETRAWEERFKDRKQELATLWEREDLLSSLNKKYLKTLEGMIRVHEDYLIHSKARTMQIASSAVAHASPPPTSPVVDRHALSVLSSFDAPDVDLVDNSRIDPSLLALNLASVGYPYTGGSRPVTSSSSVISQGPTSDATLLQSTPPSRTNIRNLVPLSPPRTVDIVSEGPSPLVSLELHPGLSPASRRRLRKRLWMRRKRALANGIPASEVPIDARKLKPGRKSKHKPRNNQGGAWEGLGSEEQPTQDSAVFVGPSLGVDSSPGDHPSCAAPKFLNSTAPCRNEGEKTVDLGPVHKNRSYGWARLNALSVDGACLCADGLDLFHLANLGNVNSLLNGILGPLAKFYETEGSCEEHMPALSYTFLLLLRAHLVHFITRLIGRVIVQKEVETRQKRRIKCLFQTNGANEINSENIREVLAILGKDPTRKRFFQRLKRAVQVRAKMATRDSPESEGTIDKLASGESEVDTDIHGSSRHALLRIFSLKSEPVLSWRPHLFQSLVGHGGDTILPNDVDDIVLKVELDEEEKIDDIDQEADSIHEHALWREIGVERDVQMARKEAWKGTKCAQSKRTREGKGQCHVQSAENRNSLRFREPGGAVKSRVYIGGDEDM